MIKQYHNITAGHFSDVEEAGWATLEANIQQFESLIIRFAKVCMILKKF